MNTDQIDRHQENTATALLAALVGLGALGALLNATGHPLAVGLALTGLGLLAVVARWVTRWLRERREDRADALAAAAWRARHQPDPSIPAGAARDAERAGVS